jgi:indolepyruvate ferredoxin oxidoreductase, beta subunit
MDIHTNATNVLIAGIGGQGVILASEILSEVAMACGLDSKKSEIHGMSQRGGIVTSHVRFGKKIHSPLIREGAADILLSFELAEAVRWLHHLSPEGRVISSLERIVPPSVSIGLGRYPENGEELIRKNSKDPILLEARPMAEALGNSRLVNTILLGVLSSVLTLPLDVWKEVVTKRVPAKLTALNLTAFEAGRKSGGAA